MESLIGAFYTNGFGSGDAQAIAGCYTTLDCSGAAVTDSEIVDARTCCIADAPLSYMTSGGGACMPCQGTL